RIAAGGATRVVLGAGLALVLGVRLVLLRLGDVLVGQGPSSSTLFISRVPPEYARVTGRLPSAAPAAAAAPIGDSPELAEGLAQIHFGCAVRKVSYVEASTHGSLLLMSFRRICRRPEASSLPILNANERQAKPRHRDKGSEQLEARRIF